MMNKVALDTNIVIDILNGKMETSEKIKEYQIIYLPVTVCGELLFGAKNSSKRQQNEPKFQAFIQQCQILEIHEVIAETYAEVRKKLKDKGRPLPENDIWIAATCLANDIPLMSHDKHFKEIEELQLISF